VTLHRQEVKNPVKARELWDGLAAVALMWPGLRFLWPIHPAMAGYLKGATPGPGNLQACGPLPYPAMTDLLARATAVITDSGGLVEEATSLGVPQLIVRWSNDRPEAVAAGLAVRCDPVANQLIDGFRRALSLTRRPSAIFGMPDAARRVADALATD
jgi:UDP-N-acetylglucosamine 2-epimerase (non-hydrolysing)